MWMMRGYTAYIKTGTGHEQSPQFFRSYCTDVSDTFCRQLPSSIFTDCKKPLFPRLFWWTHKGSNLGPLPCEGNALPLSYASGIFVHNQRPVNRRPIGRYTLSEPAIYEVRGISVKLIA